MTGKKGLLLLLSLFFVLLVLPQPLILGQKNVTVEGTVKEHSTGNPIPHANILVFRSYSSLCYLQKEADSEGYFIFELPEGGSYIIYAYYNDSQTPGFDYVPAMESIKIASGDYNLTFELWDGASLFLDGEIFLIEMTETPEIHSWLILDPESGKILHLDGYNFYYEEGSDSPSSLLGLSPNHVIVPAETPFMIELYYKLGVEKEWMARSFLIDKSGHFLLGKGEFLHVNIGNYSLSSSLSTIREEASEIGLMIDEREEEGFFLAVERQRLALITSLLLEAENYLSQGTYETCFSRLRYAYTEISNLRNWLNNMGREALRSVFLLIPFLAFTATISSHLLFEEKIKKIGGASAFYAVLVMALYLLYPGSQLVETSLFLEASLLSLLTILGLAAAFPRILKGREVRGRVPLRNMIVPVFSIAKRSLRRRRLRSTLTFITVMILVSSFIALTSFVSGFGFTFKKVSSQPGPSTGVLMRASKSLIPAIYSLPPSSGVFYTGAEPWDVFWYPPLDNSSIGWFEERPETLHVAPKMENLPSSGRLGSMGGASIFGIIGILPSAEAEFLPLNETIVEGRYLSDGDENGVLISVKLKKRLNAEVGETLALRKSEQIFRLEIIGIFDDDSFEELKDLDGGSPLPWKLTETIIRLEHGAIIRKSLTPCSTDETLVVSWKTASEIGGMWLSRLNVAVEAGQDLKEYAKMISLNKGFRVWASTGEGIYLAQFESYFQGKGLPLAVPWGIVVLNVVITMLNSLYERRREIHIYSAVGMNPSHISATFLAEAAVIGVVGGGVGYLMGFGSYKVMSFLAIGLQVKQKVSALWVLAAIVISMAAVLTGGFAALKGSVVITPSLRRKWKIEREAAASRGPLELTLPVRVPEAEVEAFVQYVRKKLRSRVDDVDYATSGIRVSREELGYCLMCGYRGPIPGRCPRCDFPDIVKEESLRTIEFSYRPTSPATTIYTSNKVVLRKEEGSEVHTVKLLTRGHPKGVQRAASLIRQIIMEWSVKRGKIEAGR